MIRISFKLADIPHTEIKESISSLGFGAAEAKRLKSISNAEAQGLSLCALLALRAALNDTQEHTVLRTERRKPYFEDLPLHFSLSHVKSLAIAALCDSDIGVDAEWIDSERRTSDIARRFFSDAERRAIECADDPLLAFYSLWTKKEAYAKLTGKGIAEIYSGELPSKLLFEQYLIELNGKRGILSVCHKKNESISIINTYKELLLYELF